MNLYKNLSQVKDTTAALWDMLYKVKIPYLQSRSIEELEVYGSVLTGVPEIDDSVGSDMMITMKSIADMAEYYREGTPIGLVNKEDAPTIYEAIQEHLLAWKNQLHVGINVGDAPVEDLVVLDEFANSVFDISKHQYKPGYDDDFLIRQLGFNNRMGPHNFFKPNILAKPDDVVRINEDDDPNLPVRDTLSDFFKDKVITLRR